MPRASSAIATGRAMSCRRLLSSCNGAQRRQTRFRAGEMAFHRLPQSRAQHLPKGKTHDLSRRRNSRKAATGDEPAPNEQIEREEANGFLLRIVATLPPRQQEVLQLKFQNDLSYQEISEITKLSVSHVGVLLHTALKTLRARHAQAARDFIPFNPRLAS